MKILSSTGLVCGITIVAALALGMPAYSDMDAGKATFKESCVHCHGEEGAGNPVQDKFWRMRIPRLNEAYVQKKSDAELKNIILNGKRKMPAAMMGNPETAHRTKVQPEQVADLIAYVRSLKK